MRSSTLIRAYQRSRFLRNVMVVTSVCLFVLTLLWIVPWVPLGMTNGNYSAGAAVTVALALGTSVAGFGAVYLRDKSNRYEQTLVTWSSVHDELGDLRRREYFYERAVMECVRAERSGESFGVFAIRFSTGENVNSTETAAALEALAGLIRQTDSLAALGPQEVGVLGAGVTARDAPGFALRLKRTLEKATGAGDNDEVSVGWAIWGTDGTDAGTLVGLARTRMQRKTALREWAKEIDELPAAGAPDEPGDDAELTPDSASRLRLMQPESKEKQDEPAA